MNKIDTDVLINALKVHPHVPKFDPKTFYDLLMNTDEHRSSSGKFYVELPKDPELILTVGVEENEYSMLSLRRILRVVNVNEGYRPNLAKVIKGAVLHHYGFFDSTDMTRRLRANTSTNFELRESPWPYALLAKLETRANTQDIDEKGNPRPLITRTIPLFILPGAGNQSEITSWELENAIYRKHGRRILGFSAPEVITEAKYLELGGTPLRTQQKR